MKKDGTLIIDTRSNEETVITFIYNGKEIKESVQTHHAHSQAVLPLIEKVLSGRHLSLHDITYIEVPVDTGSYTGRRVGVAIARTLGVLLSVPVNGKRADHPIEIPYDTNKW